MKKGNNSFSKGFSKYFAKNKTFFAKKIATNPTLRPSLVAAFSLFLGIFVGTYVIPINATYANSNIDISDASTSNDYTQIDEKTNVEKTEIASLVNRGNGSARSVGTSTSSSAVTPTAGANLVIPSLGIATSVSASNLSNHELSVPSSSVSYYGTLLMGHSSGVFTNLPRAGVGQEITYNGRTYVIDSVRANLPVSSDRQKVGNYSMYVLTNLGANRIVLMTCAGSYQAGFGYTHRTLVFATLQ